VSPIGTKAYTNIERTIKEIFPQTLVTPSLVIGATDGRHYYQISDQVYRFVPYHLDAATLAGFHGVNERVAVKDVEDGVRFYKRLMQAE
ncbi:MAG: M20/M25/M40 family metallo-hydrolase, partial [Bacteroidota bacterium]